MDTDIFLTADRFPLVREIGRARTDGLYAHPDRILDSHVFLFVTEGRMQVKEEHTEYWVGEREHLFLKKGLHHWGLPRTMPGTSWYWIHFDDASDGRVSYKEHAPLPELELNNYDPDHYAYRIPLPKFGTSSFHQTLENRLNELTVRFANPAEHGMTFLSIHAYQLFLELGQALKDVAVTGGKRPDRLTGRVMVYLKRHSDQEFDAKSLSSILNLNYSYISAAFKKRTGQSIIEAHTKLRMNNAIELMRTGSMNISEISERLGYQNPYYFSRVFKKTLGESPSSYMNKLYK